MVQASEFAMAPTTVTMAIVYHKKELDLQAGRTTTTPMVLVGWRQDSSKAFPGAPCLPGGFLDIPEVASEAASRETEEETHLEINPSRWKIFYIDDTPGSDPRYDQVINLCYAVKVSKDEFLKAKAGDDLKDAKWVPYDEVLDMDLAFNHNTVVEELVHVIRRL